MGIPNMLSDCKMARVQNAAAAAQTALLSSAIDAQLYDGVLFIAALGVVTSGCVLGLQAQDSASSGGTYANCGSALSFTDAGTASNGLLVLDVIMPQQRYLKVNLTRTVQNAAIDSVVAIAYRSKSKPSIADATVIASLLTEASS